MLIQGYNLRDLHFIKGMRWAAQSIKKRGLGKTIKGAASVIVDLSFDLKYGTDTIRWVYLKNLKIDSENKAHGALYQATKARPLCKLLRNLNRPRNSVFIDLGSGECC